MRFLFFMLAGFVAVSCNVQPAPEQVPEVTLKEVDSLPQAVVENEFVKIDSVSGDFNGDGKNEAAWLVPPKIDVPGESCVGDCISTIRFSDASIQPVRVEQCIGGQPINLGDLNDDGADEIGLNPEWFTSCWSGYRVFTTKNNKPTDLVPAISVHCDQMEQGIAPIQKDKKRKGYVIVKSSEMTDGGLVVKEESIRLN